MRNIYITFGGRAYDETTGALFEILRDGHGVDDVQVYDDKWLVDHQDLNGNGYRSVNSWLWETPRKFGFGWCAWKPYIIIDALSRLRNGDVVFYVDADCVPIADLSIVFDIARRDGLMLFDCQGFTNSMMTRHDCLMAMGLDKPEIANAKAACARFCAFRKGSFLAQQILMEWYTYSINPLCQQWGFGDWTKRQPGDVHSVYTQEYPDFFRHSTEQSVLAALASKYNVQLYREACQFGCWDKPPDVDYYNKYNVIHDAYPQLFEQQDARGPRALEGSRFRNVSHINLEFA
jgi:hypothetical protein